MCGRYSLATGVDALRGLFDVRGEVPDLAPRWNVAPTQPVAVVVVTNERDRALRTMRWGLIPSWAKDPAIGNRMINARAETLAEKPSFRGALRRRRCLVLADGFHERMPVILPRQAWDRWLDPAPADPASLAPLLVPCPPGLLAVREASPRVNSPANEGPDLPGAG